MKFIQLSSLLSFSLLPSSAGGFQTPGWAPAGSLWPSPWSCAIGSMSTAWLPQTSAGETVELNIKHYQRLNNKHHDRYFEEQGCKRVCLECNTNTRQRTCLTRRFKIFNVFSKLINSTSAWWGTSGECLNPLKNYGAISQKMGAVY